MTFSTGWWELEDVEGCLGCDGCLSCLFMRLIFLKEGSPFTGSGMAAAPFFAPSVGRVLSFTYHFSS